MFGQKNGLAIFKRNAVVMQGELLQKGKTKSYFDDIIGKAQKFGYENLQMIFQELLERCLQYSWKLKPRKTLFGFEEIETVGIAWSENGVGIGSKCIDMVTQLRFPRSKSEAHSLLGLANQFRERIPGYVWMVTALTALIRGKSNENKSKENKGKEKGSSVTPEGLIEFENLKVVLSSPAVLQQFKYMRPTIVYIDASVGSDDCPGGLGVVIVQKDKERKEYVCAYASSGLTGAQKNYHIVRLELLVLVYACGKFYDWLSGVRFVW